jgi:hypothetical protein
VLPADAFRDPFRHDFRHQHGVLEEHVLHGHAADNRGPRSEVIGRAQIHVDLEAFGRIQREQRLAVVRIRRSIPLSRIVPPTAPTAQSSSLRRSAGRHLTAAIGPSTLAPRRPPASRQGGIEPPGTADEQSGGGVKHGARTRRNRGREAFLHRDRARDAGKLLRRIRTKFLPASAVPGLALTFGTDLLCARCCVHAWIVLFFVQASLVARGRTDLHLRVGPCGVALAAAMVLLGTLGALIAARRPTGFIDVPVPPLQFLAIPMADMLLFAIFVTLAVARRRIPQSHKRWMLLATINLLTAAIARWPGILDQGPLVSFGLTDLFVVALALWDLRGRGGLHPVTLWGGPLVIASQPLRLVLSGTEGWASFARWATGLLG